MKRINNLFTLKRVSFILIFVLSTVLMLLPVFYKVQFQHFKSLGLLGIGLINFFGSATVFLPSPAILSVGIGGTLYNPLLVAFVSAVGSSLGESTGFLFGYSGEKVIDDKKPGLFYKLYQFVFEKYGAYILIFMAFIPNPLFDAVGIFAGVAQYPIKKFLLYVFIGRFARDIIISFAFSKI